MLLEYVAKTWVLYAFSFLFFTTTSNDSSRLLALTRTGRELQHKIIARYLICVFVSIKGAYSQYEY